MSSPKPGTIKLLIDRCTNDEGGGLNHGAAVLLALRDYDAMAQRHTLGLNRQRSANLAGLRRRRIPFNPGVAVLCNAILKRATIFGVR